MDYKDHEKKDITGITKLMRDHLLAKFENYHGIIEVVEQNNARYYGINKKDTLEKSIEYYNSREGCVASWFYVRNLIALDKEQTEKQIAA